MCKYLDNEGHSTSAFAEAVSQTKQSTRKYAQRQIKWIRNKLLPAVQEVNSQSSRLRGTIETHAYLLDATSLYRLSTNAKVCHTDIFPLSANYSRIGVGLGSRCAEKCYKNIRW